MTTSIHKSVLLQEIIENLNLQNGLFVFDGTLGGGGYSIEIAKKISPNGILFGTDLDSTAIEKTKERLKDVDIEKKFYQKNFSEIENILNDTKKDKLDRIVLDLGFSSDQLSKKDKGISFQNLDDDLNMNLSNSDEEKITAAEILNTWKEESLADIFFFYGGERASKKVAKAIVDFRKKQEIRKVRDLVEIIESEIGYFYKNKKIHPATKIFQALRITVNDELGNLERFLKSIPNILKKDGLVAIVTFHSLEDRMVKRYFRKLEDDGVGKRVNKKVIKPTEQEVKENPRARSAKLRVFKKT